MKLNIKLQKPFLQEINALDKEYYSIFGIPLKEKNKLFSFIQNNLTDDCYFVYKEGNTKFNHKLEIIQKNDIVRYFNEDYVIYSLTSLDFLSIDIFDDSPYNVEGYELTVTGKFVDILKKITDIFEFDYKESRLPK